MAEVLIGAMGRSVSREGASVRVSGPAATLGFWEGRGGLPLSKIERIIRKHEERAGRESARVVLEGIRHNIPRATGRTARTFGITHTDLGEVKEWRVGSSDDNAIRLEDGTGIYGPRRRVIRPKPGHKYMRFPARASGRFRVDDTPRVRRGSAVRAPYVYKKTTRGMRPRRYLEQTVRETAPIVIRLHKEAARAAAMELKAR